MSSSSGFSAPLVEAQTTSLRSGWSWFCRPPSRRPLCRHQASRDRLDRLPFRDHKPECGLWAPRKRGVVFRGDIVPPHFIGVMVGIRHRRSSPIPLAPFLLTAQFIDLVAPSRRQDGLARTSFPRSLSHRFPSPHRRLPQSDRMFGYWRQGRRGRRPRCRSRLIRRAPASRVPRSRRSMPPGFP